MNLAIDANTWPGAILVLGLVFLVLLAVGGTFATIHEFHKTRVLANQENELRQLVQRFEQLSANTLDVQQRAAADLSELRSRATAIEQILRTVD
jgi:phosphopantetheine adenylyltransferase